LLCACGDKAGWEITSAKIAAEIFKPAYSCDSELDTSGQFGHLILTEETTGVAGE